MVRFIKWCLWISGAATVVFEVIDCFSGLDYPVFLIAGGIGLIGLGTIIHLLEKLLEQKKRENTESSKEETE